MSSVSRLQTILEFSRTWQCGSTWNLKVPTKLTISNNVFAAKTLYTGCLHTTHVDTYTPNWFNGISLMYIASPSSPALIIWCSWASPLVCSTAWAASPSGSCPWASSPSCPTTSTSTWDRKVNGSTGGREKGKRWWQGAASTQLLGQLARRRCFTSNREDNRAEKRPLLTNLCCKELASGPRRCYQVLRYKGKARTKFRQYETFFKIKLLFFKCLSFIWAHGNTASSEKIPIHKNQAFSHAYWLNSTLMHPTQKVHVMKRLFVITMLLNVQICMI